MYRDQNKNTFLDLEFGIWNISDEMGTVFLPNLSKQTVAFEANSKETPFHFLDSIKLVIKAKLCAM